MIRRVVAGGIGQVYNADVLSNQEKRMTAFASSSAQKKALSICTSDSKRKKWNIEVPNFYRVGHFSLERLAGRSEPDLCLAKPAIGLGR